MKIAGNQQKNCVLLAILLSWRFEADVVQDNQMTVKIPEVRHQSRRRRHFRGYRRFKVVLFALGIAGLVLGLIMIGWYALRGNEKLLNMGVLYVLASLAVFGLRGIMVYLGQTRDG